MVTAAELFLARLRECFESGSEIQHTSKESVQAKYIWLMYACPRGATVASAKRGDAFMSFLATTSRRAPDQRCDLRSTVIGSGYDSTGVVGRSVAARYASTAVRYLPRVMHMAASGSVRWKLLLI